MVDYQSSNGIPNTEAQRQYPRMMTSYCVVFVNFHFKTSFELQTFSKNHTENCKYTCDHVSHPRTA